METAHKSPRRYKWPWAVAAAVVLAIVLAVIWMSFAVREVERERAVDSPLPGGGPTR
jgi:type VI protein secretion system component VasK